MTDKEIVERAKEAEKRTGFGELVHSPISKGVNSAYGIGFIEGMVEYRNSLQEEPKKCMYSKDEYTDEDRKVLCDGCEEDCEYNKKERKKVPSIPNIVDEHFYEMLGEEPVSEEWIEELRTKLDSLSKEDFKKVFDKYAVDFNEEPVSEDLEKVVEEIVDPTVLNAYGTKELARRLRNTICGTSVSEDLEEAIDTYLATYFGGEKEKQDWPFLKKMTIHLANWQKQKDSIPVSEDLGEYINELSKQFPEVSFAKLSRIAVRVAKWQKQQDQSTIELAEDHAMLAGMEKMKEEMMAKAIDAQCFGFQGAALFSFRLPASNYLVGSEVKVIVIKED